MHDQPKQTAALLDPAVIAQRKKEEDALGKLYNTTLTKRLAKEYSTDALVENSEILNEVPEAYTFYNYRREILLHLWQPFTSAHTTQAQVNMLLEELKLNSALMKKNYKIYSAFTHRRWILEQLACLAKREANERDGVNNEDTNRNTGSGEYIAESVWRSVIAKELAQCELLLRADERNFHAWNYRRWVLTLKKKENNSNSKIESTLSSDVTKLDVCDKSKDANNDYVSLFTSDELLEDQFTSYMINHNFSNYSAWHQRALLLQGALSRLTKQPLYFAQQQQHYYAKEKQRQEEEQKERSKAIHIQLIEEIIVRVENDVLLLINAMYCDPNDQAAWFYAPYLHQVKKTVMTLLQTNYHNNNDYNNHDKGSNWTNEGEEKITELKRMIESDCNKLIQEAARVHVTQSEFADEKCFLPAYFILSTLLSTLSGKNNTSNNNNDINKYAVLLDAELHALISKSCNKEENEINDVENINNDSKDKGSTNSLRLISIVEYLYTHLMRVDEMRKGLYTAQRNQLIEILSKTV